MYLAIFLVNEIYRKNRSIWELRGSKENSSNMGVPERYWRVCHPNCTGGQSSMLNFFKTGLPLSGLCNILIKPLLKTLSIKTSKSTPV
jgi:hypothetical protein